MDVQIKLTRPLYIDGLVVEAEQVKLVNELYAKELFKKGYAIPVDTNQPDEVEKPKKKK